MRKSLSVYCPPVEEVSDWNGNPLHPKARDAVRKGNTVRIQVYDEQSAYGEAIYATVLSIDEKDIITAKVDGVYRTQLDRLEILPNGTVIGFPRHCITEIPLQWPENSNLKKLKRLQSGLSGITGMTSQVKGIRLIQRAARLRKIRPRKN